MNQTPNNPPHNLAEEIGKRQQFNSLRQEAFLNLLRTESQLSNEFSHLYKQHGLTGPKYNALRILRGEGKPLQVYQIADRMVTPQTDVTRLVERLADDGLVVRQRCDMDRRVVWVKLTPKATSLLKKLDKPVSELHESQFLELTNSELTTLNKLLFKARRKPIGA